MSVLWNCKFISSLPLHVHNTAFLCFVVLHTLVFSLQVSFFPSGHVFQDDFRWLRRPAGWPC